MYNILSDERGIHMDAYDVQNNTPHPSTNYPFIKFINKPVMIYYFIDPICKECWTIEKSIKKLTMKYGAFFNVRPIISHLFGTPNSHCKNRFPMNQWDSYYISIGIKAAALQGNKAGRDFLRNIQELIFLYQTDESTEVVLYEAAFQANLDINEFKNDLFSPSALKAYQGDMHLIQEMEVEQFPTLVFFSQHIEDYSIKVSGLESYETYAYLLKKMIQSNTNTKQRIPPLEIYLKSYRRVQTEEVAFIFEIPIKIAENKLKKLQLERKVKKVESNGKTFWEYQGEN